MRRLIAALAVGGVLAAGAYGAAASLGGIGTSSLGADATAVLSCDTNGVTVAYNSAYSNSAPAGYKVDSVAVTGIDDDCNGLTVSATLTKGGASIASGQAAVGVGGPDDNHALIGVGGQGGQPLAEDVDGLHLQIANVGAPPPPNP